jgi:hypothetical protein
LAVDNAIGKSTVYAYLDEGFTVLAAQAPGLDSALPAAKMAGHSHISIDGTLIETDRVRTPGPTSGVDLWWSGKHANHGGNIQVITAPDAWPLWTSQVRPGGEHDTTALREHPDILPALTTCRLLGRRGAVGAAEGPVRVPAAHQRMRPLHRRAGHSAGRSGGRRRSPGISGTIDFADRPVHAGWGLASPSLTPQGYLRAELRRRNPTALPRLHRTAALWCLQHGEPMAAIGHAVEGQDNDLAASLVTACLVTA